MTALPSPLIPAFSLLACGMPTCLAASSNSGGCLLPPNPSCPPAWLLPISFSRFGCRPLPPSLPTSLTASSISSASNSACCCCSSAAAWCGGGWSDVGQVIRWLGGCRLGGIMCHSTRDPCIPHAPGSPLDTIPASPLLGLAHPPAGRGTGSAATHALLARGRAPRCA